MESDSPLCRLNARIEGRVHGVGFRYFVRTEARRLQVDGWVRNDRDGAVSVVAEGPRDRLERLADRLRTGPSSAAVTNAHLSWSEASGEFSEFSVRYF